MISQIEFSLIPFPKGIHLVTGEVLKKLPKLPELGLVHLLLKHTSAALCLNENADPSVRIDFNEYFKRLVPENQSYFEHTLEGADDMPAHIKSSILGQQLTLPITKHTLNLGTWQGIYLCEFRNQGGSRSFIATIYS